MSSIRLHPKHGVNPSVQLCFFCGEGKAVLLLGFNKDKEAPREMVTDYEPCDKCKAGMAQGITLVEAQDTPVAADQQPIQERPSPLYPTGRWCVVKESFIEKNFPAAYAEPILEKRKCFIDKGVMDGIMAAQEKAHEH